MTNRYIQWSGHDLTPLCYESVKSALLRLAWRNALNQVLLKQHFSSMKVRFCLNLPSLLDQTKWYLDERRVQAFDEEQRNGRGVWLAENFRFCPLCLEACYHSDLHQCVALPCCPFHGIKLVTQCQCCGEPTARYDVSKNLFFRAYRCYRCHGPIAGAEPSMDAHLDLRNGVTSLRRAFEPYEEWWNCLAERRNEVWNMCRNRPPELQGKWCKAPEFLRSLALKDRAAPILVRPAGYRSEDVVVLKWKYRAQLGNVADYFNAQGRRPWWRRVKI